MEQRISLVMLGVADLPRTRRFYAEGLGWTPTMDLGEVVFFQAGGIVVALWSLAALLADAGLAEGERAPGRGGIALAHNVRSRDQVDVVLDRAAAAGARVTRGAKDAEWGGRSGYFTDPDGHLWEVAWNPDWPIDAAGNVRCQPAT